mmetsp:Transcript_14698/g.46143  ORF Transcript_14698/g.46143 Transcript_14698/m.46143 type:complete len:238 (+) Transcript_14698:1230-1943(+)
MPRRMSEAVYDRNRSRVGDEEREACRRRRCRRRSLSRSRRDDRGCSRSRSRSSRRRSRSLSRRLLLPRPCRWCDRGGVVGRDESSSSPSAPSPTPSSLFRSSSRSSSARRSAREVCTLVTDGREIDKEGGARALASSGPGGDSVDSDRVVAAGARGDRPSMDRCCPLREERPGVRARGELARRLLSDGARDRGVRARLDRLDGPGDGPGEGRGVVEKAGEDKGDGEGDREGWTDDTG